MNINMGNFDPRQGSPGEQILRGCSYVEGMLYYHSDTIPTLGCCLGLRLLDVERNIIRLAKYIDAATEYTLNRMVTDYLPNLVQTYINAAQSGVREEEKFDKQVALMLGAITKIFEAVKNDNGNALEVQRVFLESKFGGNSFE